MANEISEELKQFIRQYITSLEQLEILLLLHQSAERSWKIEEIFKIVQTNPVSVSERLKTLVSAGFVTAEGPANSLFRFQPKSPDFTKRTAELRDAYAVSKYKIIETIFSKPSDQAQKFADSFKFRSKND